MVQTDTQIKAHKITCVNCGARHEANLENLKFRANMKPFVCELCARGIILGDVQKLEKYILENYDIDSTTTIVDYIINKLSSNKL